MDLKLEGLRIEAKVFPLDRDSDQLLQWDIDQLKAKLQDAVMASLPPDGELVVTIRVTRAVA